MRLVYAPSGCACRDDALRRSHDPIAGHEFVPEFYTSEQQVVAAFRRWHTAEGMWSRRLGRDVVLYWSVHLNGRHVLSITRLSAGTTRPHG